MAELTDNPRDPRLTHGPDTEPVEQAEVYLILSEEERAKGFIRPLRKSYWHSKCGTVTTMSLPIAETYARNPNFYGGTYCVGCQMHLSVGEHGEFYWVDNMDHVCGVFGTPLEHRDHMMTHSKVGT